MEEFKFYMDKKVTMWEREHYKVEAESKEEAILRMKTIMEDGYSDTECIETESLYDTIADMSYDSNDHNPTIEVYYQDTNNSELIMTNEPI